MLGKRNVCRAVVHPVKRGLSISHGVFHGSTLEKSGMIRHQRPSQGASPVWWKPRMVLEKIFIITRSINRKKSISDLPRWKHQSIQRTRGEARTLWKRNEVISESFDNYSCVYDVLSDKMKQIFPTGKVRQPRVLSSLEEKR